MTISLEEALRMCERADAAYYAVYREWCEVKHEIALGYPGSTGKSTLEECEYHVRCRMEAIERMKIEIDKARQKYSGAVATSLVDLGKKLAGIESEYALIGEPECRVSVILNGTMYSTKNSYVTYEDIVHQFAPGTQRPVQIEWTTGVTAGNLIKGQRIELEHGMRFSVTYADG